MDNLLPERLHLARERLNLSKTEAAKLIGLTSDCSVTINFSSKMNKQYPELLAGLQSQEIF